jgi:hypothetical protein
VNKLVILTIPYAIFVVRLVLFECDRMFVDDLHVCATVLSCHEFYK